MRTIAAIIDEVASRYGTEASALTGPRRRLEYSVPRHEAMFLARQQRRPDGLHRWSMSTIARAFNRDHTTVRDGILSHARRIGLPGPDLAELKARWASRHIDDGPEDTRL